MQITSTLTRNWRKRTLLTSDGPKSTNLDAGDLAVTIAVIAVLLLALIPLVTYSATTNLLPLTRGNQDYQSALAAAESGVSNFINVVNQNTSTPPSSLSTASWVRVTGSANEYYYYTSTYQLSNDTFKIQSTGIALHGAQTQTRTIRETITPVSFTSFELYYSSMQIAPGLASQVTGSPSYWTLNNLPPGNTSPGTFYTNGNYFLNQKTSFLHPPSGVTLETGGQPTPPPGQPSSPFCTNSGWFNLNNSQCGAGTTPITSTSSPIKLVPPVSFPTTLNTKALISAAQSFGCYYVGPTEITFATPPNSTQPTFYVYSPETPLSPTATGATNYNVCGGGALDNYPGGAAISGSPGAFASAFTSGLIYVDQASSSQCTNAISSDIPTYYYNNNPCDGTAIVNGTTGGQINVTAADAVVVDGDLVYADCTGSAVGNNDVTGLAATSNIEIPTDTWQVPPPLSGGNYPRPNACSSVTGTLPTTGAIVMGALFALNGSVIPISNSNCSKTLFSQIEFYGSIATLNAGLNGFPTSTYQCTNAHFNNSLTYDNRLATLIPPNFPFPVADFTGGRSERETTVPPGLPALP